MSDGSRAALSQGEKMPSDGTAQDGRCLVCNERFSRRYYVSEAGPYCAQHFPLDPSRQGGDIIERLREKRGVLDNRWPGPSELELEAANEIERLRDFMNWVDSWVSNPVTAYSVSALDGIFGMTRDKLAALSHTGTRKET